jgi:hypothetical protein
VVYCIAEPIYRIATGTSIMNLDGQPGLAPFEVNLAAHLMSLPSRFFL